jgi:molybdate transport system ATP-binding protein
MIEFDLSKQLQSDNGRLKFHFSGKIENGKCVAIQGASGAGKTSLLRMLAGLMSPNSGRIVVNGEVWYDHAQHINLSPQKRQLGFVFQDYGLFPHLSVAGNLKFALQKGQSNAIIEELLDITQLQQLRHQKPSQLSGGQQQRVALARSLVQLPQILLLDEPLAALDEKMRSQLQNFLKNWQKKYEMTMLLVSHDQNEIAILADEIWNIKDRQIREKQAVNVSTQKVCKRLKIEAMIPETQCILVRMMDQNGNYFELSLLAEEVKNWRVGQWVQLAIA